MIAGRLWRGNPLPKRNLIFGPEREQSTICVFFYVSLGSMCIGPWTLNTSSTNGISFTPPPNFEHILLYLAKSGNVFFSPFECFTTKIPDLCYTYLVIFCSALNTYLEMYRQKIYKWILISAVL